VVKLDQRDIEILSILQQNGRIKNSELAVRVGLAPSSCLARMRRLEKARVIRSYHARLDVNRIARNVQCVVLIKLGRHGSGAFHSFASELRKIPEVVECLMLSGAFDFLVKVVCADMGRYNVINDRLLNFGVAVESVSSYVVMEQTMPYSGIALETLTDDGEEEG
jgi:DNA-binding Lrp family transcriptional regulator